MLSDKLANVIVTKEKIQAVNTEMRSVVFKLEKELKIQHDKSQFEKSLDQYVKEIESLKHRISKYDTERNAMFNELNNEATENKKLKNKIYDLENNMHNNEDDEDCDD